MIASMTGFGSGRAKTKEIELEVTVKSLNGRFLEARLHLPREYGGLEGEIKRLLQAELIRGTVDVYIQRRPIGRASVRPQLNEQALAGFLKTYREVARRIGVAGLPSVGEVLSQPEVFSWTTSTASSAEKTAVLKALKVALGACQGERRREGRAIEAHIKRLLTSLMRSVDQMSQMAEVTRDELAKRLEERLAKSPLQEKVDGNRLNQELALYLDRADVEEEIQRLKEHLRQCQKLLAGSAFPGKKLDFYSQELHREVNTIGSKSPLPALTAKVVEAKALIEQVKEQVQNII